MPENLEEDNILWKTYKGKPGLVTVFKKSEGTMFPSSSSSIRQEKLNVEDLEVTTPQHSTSLHRSNRNSRLQLPHCSNAVEAAISAGNFTVYQGGDLNEFFGCDVFTPTRVSEVCLVNDHYILVKIPELLDTQNNIQSKKPYNTLRNPNLTTEPETKGLQCGKKVTRYLQCGNGRSRRVSPAPAPTRIDESTTAKKPWSTDSCVQEVFESRTIITGKLNAVEPENSTKIEKQNIFQAANTKNLANCPENSAQEPLKNTSPRMPLKTSLDEQVELEMHGRLEALQDDFSDSRRSTRSHLLPRPRQTFGQSFSWLLRSFRSRLSAMKSSKIKKKISAVVYKTFFVTWAKPEELSSCPACCGLKRSLRRTRSAVF